MCILRGIQRRTDNEQRDTWDGMYSSGSFECMLYSAVVVDKPHLTVQLNKRVRGERSKNDKILYYYSWTSKTKPSWFDKELRSCSRAPADIFILSTKNIDSLYQLFLIWIPAHANGQLILTMLSLSPLLARTGQKSCFRHTKDMFSCLCPSSDVNSSWSLTSIPVS